MTKPAELNAFLFAGQPKDNTAGLLSRRLLKWMEASARYTAFVDTYRDKIRKKIRVSREADRLLDLNSELEVAYSLLNDSRLAVAYEPYASAKRRGPDFAVTYRSNLVFNIEVARIRVAGSGVSREEERMVRMLLGKLGQMQPGMANLLVVHIPAELARAVDLGRLMQSVKTRVEGKDPAFYAASRYASPAAFYKDFLRLSGILLWSTEPQVWANKQARVGLPERVLRLVFALPLGAGQAPLDQ